MIAGRGIETESWLKKIINTLNCPDITSMIITFRSSVTNVYANQNCGGSMFGWCLLPLSMNNSWQCGWFNRLFVVPYDRAITIKVEGGRGGGFQVYGPRGREERICEIHHQVWLGTFEAKMFARERKRLMTTILRKNYGGMEEWLVPGKTCSTCRDLCQIFTHFFKIDRIFFV